jgi:DegV family protein with EDD domain
MFHRNSDQSDIVVISDSSCDYNADQASAAGFTMVPLTVRFGEKSFLEGLEISPQQFYRRLSHMSGALPTTSQPSPAQFMRVFASYERARHIICITLSGALSGTVQSARMAAQTLEEQGFAPKIHIIDSLNGCTATGYIAERACRTIAAGAPIEAVLAHVEQLVRTVGIYFVPDSLEYLRRGGRIGSVKATVGGLLGIRPLITVVDGKVANPANCRGHKQVIDRLVQQFLTTAKNTHEVIVDHTNNMDYANELSAALRAAVPDISIRVHMVGAVIGTHIGPDAVGLTFEEKAVRF